jgi:hypothetical protein
LAAQLLVGRATLQRLLLRQRPSLLARQRRSLLRLGSLQRRLRLHRRRQCRRLASTPAAQPVTPGQTGQGKPGGAIGMDHLKGVLEQILGGTVGGQGRYSNDLIKHMEDQFTRNNTDLRKQEESSAIGDAAKRGVYYGTPLTNSMGDIRERFIGRQADSQNALLKQIADSKQEDQNNAIGNVFKYGEGENANQQTQSDILAKLAGIGMSGGPSMSGAYGDFNSLPQPGVSDMSDVYKLLGSLFGGGGA